MKIPTFSPAQPQRAKTRLFPSFGLVSKNPHLPHPRKKLFRQLGVVRVRMLRVRCFLAYGLVDYLFEQPQTN